VNREGNVPEMPAEKPQETIRRLQLQVTELQASVAARDKTIADLRRAAKSIPSKKKKGQASSSAGDDAGTPWFIVAADVCCSHWCDTGLVQYGELVRVSLVCTALRKKAIDCLRLLRRLDFQRDLLWPLNPDQRLQVVVKAVGQMGGGLESLDLSVLGKLCDQDSATLVSGLAPIKNGGIKEIIMCGLKTFKTVKKMLATLSSLKCLDLSKNVLGDEGV